MTARRIRMAILVYGALALLAVVWGVLREEPNLYFHPRPLCPWPFPGGTALALAFGAATALVVARGTRVLVQRTGWARRLHVEFRELLGHLSPREIAFLAITSGVAEELFFRGAMQPETGLVVTSLVFGAVHIGPSRHFWPWTAWAAVMGFVFGGLYVATGELLAPIVAHVVINYENLHFINSYDPSPPHTDAEGPRGTIRDPNLVASRLRAGGRSR